MKRLLFLFILISTKSFAQENADLTPLDTLYFNASYQETSPEQAAIIRIIYEETAQASDGYSFKEYDKNGKLERSGITKELKGSPTGMISSYYGNGIKKNEGYWDNRRKGLWKEWYQNAQLKEEVVYELDENGQLNLKMINYYDSTGNHLVINGSGLFEEFYQNDIEGQSKTKGRYKDHHPVGTWEGFYKNGQLYYKEKYNKQGKFIKGKSYDSLGNSFKYKEQGVQPFPIGGMERVYQFIAKEVKYPEIARKTDIQGRVFVQFVVDSDGSITEVEVVKGISKECDEEAARVVGLLEKWSPGLQKGQPVKVRMILPIVFRLSQ